MALHLSDAMPFAKFLGMEITESSSDIVKATLVVRPDLCTTGKIMHGGAMMSFADTLGAMGAFLNLPEGAKGTTTLESKTNFLGSAPEGSTVVGETTPVHVGRRTSVWQTKLQTPEGKLLGLVTQTQLVL